MAINSKRLGLFLFQNEDEEDTISPSFPPSQLAVG